MKKTKHVIKTAAIALCLFSGSGAVSALEPTSGFTVSGMIGQFYPDDIRGLDSSGDAGSLGIGYEWMSKWGLELNYTAADPEVENSDTNVNYWASKLDGMYYFGQRNLQPYVVLGFGYEKFDADFLTGETGESMADLGVGLRYSISELVSLRGDVRALQGLESGETDYLAAFGAMVKFGTESKPRRLAATPVPVVEGPKDSDGDGVYDNSDRCPNSPAGSEVNSSGCPLDSDGDGVANVDDKCPGSEAGAKVDSVGCYEILKEDVSVALNVLFASNSDAVSSVNYDEIQEVADFLRQYPASAVVIEGHTDSSGAAEYNRDLSQRRAEAVAKILVDRYNVASSRVKAMGFGEERPLVANDTRENMAKNRRVTAVVSAVVEKIVK